MPSPFETVKAVSPLSMSSITNGCVFGVVRSLVFGILLTPNSDAAVYWHTLEHSTTNDTRCEKHFQAAYVWYSLLKTLSK